jgi:hypothetical protein
MLELISKYLSPKQWGYSCQTLLARSTNDLLYGDKYYCWFSKHLNATENGDDSNPIWLYLLIDRAAKQRAVHNAKIRDCRLNLMAAAAKELGRQGRSAERAATVASIRTAPIEMFAPQLWRIDLTAVHGRYSSGHQYPDEFLITDLRAAEFEVIVE